MRVVSQRRFLEFSVKMVSGGRFLEFSVKVVVLPMALFASLICARVPICREVELNVTFR